MDNYKQVADHLEAVMTRLVSGAVDVLEQKMLTARVEREMGDRELQQTLVGNEYKLKALSVEVGKMQAEVATAKQDWQASINAIRSEVSEGLKTAMRDLREESKAEVQREVGVLPSIDGRLELVEKKLDAVKWAAFGLSIGSSLGGGTLVALLAGVFG